ncbi:MAG: hypothetical protein LBR10_02205 [Prevotellaceae bacterium]|nr:hypothetical protein [Prevotellaceae bacterium]
MRRYYFWLHRSNDSYAERKGRQAARRAIATPNEGNSIHSASKKDLARICIAER